MKDRDGKDVPRSAVGYKLNCIGCSRISSDGVQETKIWSWPNNDPAPELLGIDNEISGKVQTALGALKVLTDKVVAKTSVLLTINDPTAVDGSGNPIRMVRRAETNLGDLVADAYRNETGAQIAFVNGGGVRASIEKGDITYGDILKVHPYGNMICMVSMTGQAILDALEWGCRSVPDENGAFPQTSGLTYEVHSYIENGCEQDENGWCTGFSGERRVKNVMVGGEPLDPEKTYTVAGHEYMLLGHGDGYTAFDDAKLLLNRVKLDNQVLIDYITQTLGGEVGGDYADLTGQGRIVIVEKAP